jgi:polyhydroxyalkanoate synthesis regulator phasin
MAERKQSQDLLSRLASAGEDAIQRVAEAPGGQRLADAANALRARVDELQRKVRGIDELEKRVQKLEQRLTAVENKPAPRRRTASSASKPARKAGES